MKNFCFKVVAILGILFISLSMVARFSYEDFEYNAIVKAQTLNIRSQATVSDENSSVITTLERGDYLEVLSVGDTPVDGYIWAEVRFLDEDDKVKYGFCVYDYIVMAEEPITTSE